MPSARSILIRKIFELRENARMSAEQFQAMKLAKFRQLVRHANESSPYYAQLIKERSIDIGRCTPGDFPPLTKAILMAEFDRIVTDRRITKAGIADFLTRSHDPTELFLKEFRVIHTSGSSGEVGYFVYSRADWARGSAQALRPRRGRDRVRRRRRFAPHRLLRGDRRALRRHHDDARGRPGRGPTLHEGGLLRGQQSPARDDRRAQ
jgi:hypothetical protein